MQKNLLVGREYNTADYDDLPKHWYSPQELLRRYKSVKAVELFNTSSSAGDWDGWILQKLGKINYVIIFWQENNWPYSGFTVHTNNHPKISFKGEMSIDEINQILAEELEN